MIATETFSGRGLLQSSLFEHEGREFESEHEFIAFECGREILDGQVGGACSHSIG